MSFATVRSVLVVLAAGVVGIGMWVSVRAETPEGPFLSCSEAPKEAVLTLPDTNVSQWAQVACSKYGHVIVPADGYVWSLYGGFAPIAFTAQGMKQNTEPKEVRHSVHFSSITVDVLDENAAKKIAASSSWNEEVPRVAPKVWHVNATSNTGHVEDFFFLRYPDRLSGAMQCPKEMPCIAPLTLMPFFIYDARRK